MTEDNILELSRETRSSIELKRNAKREYAWDAKVYFEEGCEVNALDTLKFIDQALREQYIEKGEEA